MVSTSTIAPHHRPSPVLCHLLAGSGTCKNPLMERTLLLPAAQTGLEPGAGLQHYLCPRPHTPPQGTITPCGRFASPSLASWGGSRTTNPPPGICSPCWALWGQQEHRPHTQPPTSSITGSTGPIIQPWVFFGAGQDPPPTLPSRPMGAAGPPATPRPAWNLSLEPQGYTAAPPPPPWGLTPAAQSLPEVRGGRRTSSPAEPGGGGRTGTPSPEEMAAPSRVPGDGAGPSSSSQWLAAPDVASDARTAMRTGTRKKPVALPWQRQRGAAGPRRAMAAVKAPLWAEPRARAPTNPQNKPKQTAPPPQQTPNHPQKKTPNPNKTLPQQETKHWNTTQPKQKPKNKRTNKKKTSLPPPKKHTPPPPNNQQKPKTPKQTNSAKGKAN